MKAIEKKFFKLRTITELTSIYCFKSEERRNSDRRIPWFLHRQ